MCGHVCRVSARTYVFVYVSMCGFVDMGGWAGGWVHGCVCAHAMEPPHNDTSALCHMIVLW